MSQMIPFVQYTHMNRTTSAAKSRATIINLKNTYCVGDNMTIQIDMFDHVGNRKTHGGDFLRARMYTSGLKAAASGWIEDFSNGTYHVHFTLFWEGSISFSLKLYHPSEGVAALWNARNQGYGLIHFMGTFVSGHQEVKNECGFQLKAKALCEYHDERNMEHFYCVKPDNLQCESLSYLQSSNTGFSFLSKMELKIFSR
ncbi:Hypothetical predicted protein [Pelobates cultripes]|uniref:Uncharacterized protein n=1 Tax=Pelobates cultripes TaxID=61616 RepID=A0AAD1SW98_PELCU|nr:Hypothetical predicted protein [Pelobates cultripes]